MCLVQKNAILSNFSIVTFYKDDDGFDQYFATGYVLNIQDNGIVQVEIIHNSQEHKELLNNMCADDTMSKNINVRNHALMPNIQEIFKGER